MTYENWEKSCALTETVQLTMWAAHDEGEYYGAVELSTATSEVGVIHVNGCQSVKDVKNTLEAIVDSWGEILQKVTKPDVEWEKVEG